MRTRTALGSYGRAMPGSMRPPHGRCLSLFASNPCTLRAPVLVNNGTLSGVALSPGASRSKDSAAAPPPQELPRLCGGLNEEGWLSFCECPCAAIV